MVGQGHWVQRECWMDDEVYLSAADRAEFAANGVLVLRQFHDVATEIAPIQRALAKIVDLVGSRHGVVLPRFSDDPALFDAAYGALLAADRRYAAEVYELAKQIPDFLRLVSSERSERLFKELRATDIAGIGVGSYGIRIDNPREEKFRSQWHQEFLFQPQSIDGVVFWTPLVPVTPEMGPVVVCVGSHRDGLCRYRKGGAYDGKPGPYQIGLLDEAEVVSRYPQVAPLTELGDLILMDFLTIHQSGHNVSSRSRWSVQSRFFNFRDPTGMKIGWRSAVTAGTDIESLFVDHFVGAP